MRISDLSSDVCSSDLRCVALDALHRADALAVGAVKLGAGADLFARREGEVGGIDAFLHRAIGLIDGVADRIGRVLDGGLAIASDLSDEVDVRDAVAASSEERRVGTECVSTCRSRWSQ